MPPRDSEHASWFAEHLQPHEPMLRAWLQNRFGAQVTIDDIVQEAYVRVWQARAQGELHAENVIVRGAYARTYDEADLDGDEIGDPSVVQGNITVRNTGLKPWTADNFDLSLE